MTAVVVTGAGGYVGRRLLQRLAEQGTTEVVALTRDPSALAATVPPLPEWRYLPSSVGDGVALAEAVPQRSTILHLAAATGKTTRQEFERINVAGTAAVIEAAERSGAGRLVFVSSIAAGFPDQRHYPYAHTKRAAEELVRASALDTLTVRPTMIFGAGSPVLRGLGTLAGAPVGLRPGPGQLPVQPIDREDVVDALLLWLEQPGEGDLVELGGPEVLSMADLLTRIRLRLKGTQGPWLPLPLGALRSSLGALEPLLLPVLPLTAGQLASFANAGTASPHRRTAALPEQRSVSTMLEHLGD